MVPFFPVYILLKVSLWEGFKGERTKNLIQVSNSH